MSADEIAEAKNGWKRITFNAIVRNFAKLRDGASFPEADTSAYGNAVYIIAMNKTAESFNYKDVSIVKVDSMTTGGDNGNNADKYYQSITGLSTDLEVGTVVTVEMDVYVTGTFNSYSKVFWINDVYTVSGGESDKSRTDITSVIVTEESGWHHVTFTATVRNFPNLRYNSAYTTQDTSSYGNAVYLLSMNKSGNSFDYKNVTITVVE